MSKLPAKKSLGQNFLQDQNVLEKILQAANLTKEDTVIEVGPGKGALTEHLLRASRKVVAYELDQRLKEPLSRFSDLELHFQDILKADIQNTTFKVVANIPYYITSPIINKFLKDRALENKKLPSTIVLLIQREVAEKICSEKSSVIGLNVKTFGEPEIITIVKPQSFSPPPKIDSAVLKISNIQTPQINLEPYFKLIHASFKMPRKTIWNNLKSYHQNIKKALEKSGIKENQRPEELSKEQFQNLTQTLS